jgi:hypothetical protein
VKQEERIRKDSRRVEVKRKNMGREVRGALFLGGGGGAYF